MTDYNQSIIIGHSKSIHQNDYPFFTSFFVVEKLISNHVLKTVFFLLKQHHFQINPLSTKIISTASGVLNDGFCLEITCSQKLFEF